MSQLGRLAKQLPTSEERDYPRGDLRRAVALDSNEMFGADVNNLTSWNKLCSILNIDPIIDHIKGFLSGSCCLALVVFFQ